MPNSTSDAEDWITGEDTSCFPHRAARLQWLVEMTPASSIWLFPGGSLAKRLFEESRYCFVYGQNISSATLGFAYIERTIAAMFYGSGRNDLQRATSEKLVSEAVKANWIDSADEVLLAKIRKIRNPLMHFRPPLHEDLPQTRAFKEELSEDEILEQDAKKVLEAMFRLVEINSIPLE